MTHAELHALKAAAGRAIPSWLQGEVQALRGPTQVHVVWPETGGWLTLQPERCGRVTLTDHTLDGPREQVLTCPWEVEIEVRRWLGLGPAG